MIGLKLWWHNLWLPVREWRVRRQLMPQWIAEGRDPKDFPRAAPITRKAYDWAVSVMQKNTP